MDALEKQTLQKLPPHDLDAEQSLLGSILLANEMLHEISQICGPEMFYKSSGQKLLKAMQEVSLRGEPIDLITLKDQLVTNGTLDDVGGQSFIAQLVDIVPTGANAVYYARIVREKYIARRLLNMSLEVATKCYEEHTAVPDLIDIVQNRVLEVSSQSNNGNIVPMVDLMQGSYGRFQKWNDQKGHLIGIPSGFYDLDNIKGGFMNGELIILAARPSMGKTTLALDIACNIAKNTGTPTAFISLEMTREQLSDRMLSAESGVSIDDIRRSNLSQDDWDRIAQASNILSKIPLIIYDHSSLTAAQLIPLCKSLKIRFNIGAIFIDYLQLLRSGDKYIDSNTNMTTRITEVSRLLKALPKELNVPVIALSQLSRGVEQRSDKRPQLSDLRESGCLSGDTGVYLPIEGAWLPIKKLVGRKNTRVLSYNTISDKLTIAEVSACFSTGYRETFLLTTKSHKRIRATANHRFLSSIGWKRLDQLEVGEYIAHPDYISGSLVWTQVANIEIFSRFMQTYDLTVPKYHNFVAEHLIVHNSIEQDADVVLFMFRPEVYFGESHQGEAEVFFGKNRNGPLGNFFLYFQKETTHFLNYDKRHENTNPFSPGDD